MTPVRKSSLSVLAGESGVPGDRAVRVRELRGLATALQGGVGVTSGSTGILTGGVLSVNGDDGTKIDISAGSGYVIDDSVVPAVATLVEWAGFTAVTLVDLATETSTDIAISKAGLVLQQRRYTNTELREVVLLGGVNHAGGVINGVFSIQVPSFAAGLSVRDLARAVGDINLSGNTFAAAGTDLTVTKNSGTAFSFGRNTATSKTDPHTITQAALTPVSFSYVYRDGSGGTTVGPLVTNINPLNFDDGTGVLGTVPVNDFAYQQFLLFPNSNTVFVQHGATTFNTLRLAIEGLSTTTFAELPGFTSAMRRGVLIVRRGTTNLSTAGDARFFVADKFGSIAGAVGAGAVAYGDMLASVYDPTAVAADAFDRANHTGTQAASTITGLGTMSTQAASAVAITGGGINGTTIGASTPSTGAFTTLISTTGTVTGRMVADTGDARVYFGTLTNHPLQLQHNGTNVGQLTSTGLNATAIGATTASTGAFTTASASTSVTTPSVTNAGTLALSATGANVITASTNGVERMRIASGGNVGIGTTTPAEKLSVSGNADVFGDGSYFAAKNGAGGVTRIGITDNTTSNGYLDTSNAWLFKTGGTDRMAIVNGNVGIGVLTFGTSAAKVLGLANATAPTSSPAGMGQLYVESGALKYRGSSGTVTTIANA